MNHTFITQATNPHLFNSINAQEIVRQTTNRRLIQMAVGKKPAKDQKAFANVFVTKVTFNVYCNTCTVLALSRLYRH